MPNDKKAPYLTLARDNRAAIRMKKTQQVGIVCAGLSSNISARESVNLLCDMYPFSSSKMSCANTQVELTACPLCPISILEAVKGFQLSYTFRETR